jgi:hypothetical protein
MPNSTSGFRSVRLVAAALLAAGLAGCGTGPLDQPDSALPALKVQARFGATIPATATRVTVQLAAIPYCPAGDGSDVSNALPAAAPTPPPAWRSLDEHGDTIGLTANAGGDPRAFGCPYVFGAPLIRFFEPLLYFDPFDGQGPPVPWVARDKIVVYVDTWVTFQPQGPTDDSITLAPGYSVLRRTCSGGDKAWRVESATPDEPMTFSPSILPNFHPQPRPPERTLREQSERLLLKECGIEPPVANLGARLTFDRATSIQFSADGSELLYMVGIDPGDADRLASLRTVDLSTGSVRQVAAVRDAYKFQITERPAEIYVWTQTDFQRLRVDRETWETIGKVTVSPDRFDHAVSPDGRWITFLEYTPESGGGDTRPALWIEDTDTGAARLWDKGFSSWTPASQLMMIENPTETGAYSYVVIISPADGQEVARFPFVGVHRVFWSDGIPYSIASPIVWGPVASESKFIGNGREFGVSGKGPGAGDAIEVLDQSAGSVEVAARSEGAAFLWTRRCLGLFETVCTYELHRVAIPTLEDRIVAVSASAAPVAVSPRGDRIAIAAQDGVFIRSLP